MKKVVVAIFTEESKTYEALSELKSHRGTTQILTAGILKNDNGQLSVKDGFNFDEPGSNWAAGGLLGGLVGLLGGPVGALLGGGFGSLIGTGIDVDETDLTQSVLQKVTSRLGNYQLALLVIVDEYDVKELDQFFSAHSSNFIMRENFVDVQTEIYEAEELEEYLAKEAKKKRREVKKEKWRAKAEARQQEMQEKFDRLKNRTKRES